jgi:hypothetical protein
MRPMNERANTCSQECQNVCSVSSRWARRPPREGPDADRSDRDRRPAVVPAVLFPPRWTPSGSPTASRRRATPSGSRRSTASLRGTSTYGHPTAVRVEVHDTAPDAPDGADHEAEVLLLGEGPVAVLSWGDDEPVATAELPDGPCRLRGSWFGVADAEAHPEERPGRRHSIARATAVPGLARRPGRGARVTGRWGGA